MSRFDNLEFDDREDPAPQKARPQGSSGPVVPPSEPAQFSGSTGTPIRDATYFSTEGDVAFHVDQLEAALRNYSRALEQDNTLFEGWLGQVRVLLETAEYNEADLWAGKALEMFPEQPELLAVKAIASIRMGKSSMALAQSDNALARKGVTSFVWLARAEILMATRKPMAEHCLAKAVELSVEGTSRGWTNWEVARLLRRYRRSAQALVYAHSAVQLLPGEAGVWLELARGQLALKMPEAKQSLEQALHIDRNCAAAQRLLKDYREPGLLRRLLFWRKG